MNKYNSKTLQGLGEEINSRDYVPQREEYHDSYGNVVITKKGENSVFIGMKYDPEHTVSYYTKHEWLNSNERYAAEGIESGAGILLLIMLGVALIYWILG